MKKELTKAEIEKICNLLEPKLRKDLEERGIYIPIEMKAIDYMALRYGMLPVTDIIRFK